MPDVTVNPVIDIDRDIPIQVYYLDSGTAIFKCVASPEGVVFAKEGSIAVSDTGLVYVKSTSLSVNTGWEAIATIPSGGNVETRIVTDLSNTATSGTGLDSLTSITIPANTLAIGDRLIIVADGNFNGVAGNKRLAVIGDGFTIFDTGLVAINNSNWHLEIQALRVSAIGFLLTVRLSTNGFGVTSTPNWFAATAFQTPNFGAAYVFQCLGEVANAADSVSQGNFIASLL